MIEDPQFLLAHCLTEPRGASDRWLPYNVPEAAMQTKSVKTNGGWIVNGRKQFISNGYDAGLYVVYANTNPKVVAEVVRLAFDAGCEEAELVPAKTGNGVVLADRSSKPLGKPEPFDLEANDSAEPPKAQNLDHEYSIPATIKFAWLGTYFVFSLALTLHNKFVLGSVS